MSLLRRRMMADYIRDDADEELDYFTVIPYCVDESLIDSECDMYAAGYEVVNEQHETVAYSDIYYSINGGEWILANYEIPFKVKHLDRVRLKCNGYDIKNIWENVSTGYRGFNAPVWTQDSSFLYMVEGTPLSLLHGDNFKEKKNILMVGCFAGMLSNNDWFVQINNPRTFLPSTELSPWCYGNMFYNCKIGNAPVLPAEILAEGCYSYMFSECDFLNEAPELNAKTLVPYCYECMFYKCETLRYTKFIATEGFEADGAIEDMYNSVYGTGVCVLSQELIDAGFHEAFFSSDWTAVNEKYPTNDEGYPNTESFEDEFCLLNTYYDGTVEDDVWFTLRVRNADDLSITIYNDLKDNNNVGSSLYFPYPWIYVDGLGITEATIFENHILFRSSGFGEDNIIELYSDGEIVYGRRENILMDYMQV
jgi:hypothetical protein